MGFFVSSDVVVVRLLSLLIRHPGTKKSPRHLDDVVLERRSSLDVCELLVNVLYDGPW
jgi:hypothetical protein